MLSEADQKRLEAIALMRLRSLFPLLQFATLLCDFNRNLNIICSTQAHCDAILKQHSEIQQQAYLSLGCGDVLVWVAAEDLKSGVSVEDEPMPTATLEKPATANNSANSAAKNRLPGQTLENVAADLEQPLETIRAWFVDQGIQPIPFGEMEIVSGEAAIGAYAHFEPLVIRARMQRRGLALPELPDLMPATQNGNGNRSTATATKTAAKSTAKTVATKSAAATKTTSKKTTAKKPAAKAGKTAGN